MMALLAVAVNPGEARGLVELAIALIGITKWPIAGVAGLAGFLSYERYHHLTQQGLTPSEDGKLLLFSAVCLGAAMCLLIGLLSP